MCLDHQESVSKNSFIKTSQKSVNLSSEIRKVTQGVDQHVILYHVLK